MFVKYNTHLITVTNIDIYKITPAGDGKFAVLLKKDGKVVEEIHFETESEAEEFLYKILTYGGGNMFTKYDDYLITLPNIDVYKITPAGDGKFAVLLKKNGKVIEEIHFETESEAEEFLYKILSCR